MPLDGWLRSVLGDTVALTQHNWVDRPFEKCESAVDWIGTRSEDEVDAFYHVALGAFLREARLYLLEGTLGVLAEARHEAIWSVQLRNQGLGLEWR